MKNFIRNVTASGLLVCSLGAVAVDEPESGTPALRGEVDGQGAIVAEANAEPPTPDLTFSGNVALTNDYAFRGISQTDENPAIQGGFNVNHVSGFYAGTWASNVDFNEDESGGLDGATLELDVFGGFASKFGSSELGYDVGVLGYLYPGADEDRNYDYAEVYAGLTYNMFTVKYYYSPEFFAETGTAHYIDLTANVPLPNDFGLLVHVGHQAVEDNTLFGAPDYTDYRIGVNKKVAGFGLDLSYVDSNLDEGECFGGLDWCDARVVFTVSRSL
ncbi:MAG: TorF family putative porin [Gammaproteobacteria bacterium]